MQKLMSKVALVTGASRGIGKAIALKLAQEGCLVAMNYTSNDEAAQNALLEVKKFCSKALLIKFDVSHEEQIEQASLIIKEKLGPVDILINNAGISMDSLLLRLKKEDLDKQLDINLKGAILCSKIFIKDMLKNKNGRIINVTSVAGEMGNSGQCAYAAAKAGLIGFTKSLAKEIGRKNITVNAISPGFIQTDMTEVILSKGREHILEQIPLGRIGNPEDIAHAAAFLVSEDASYITGQVLSVNGGLYI